MAKPGRLPLDRTNRDPYLIMSALHSPYHVAHAALESIALQSPYDALLGEIGPATSIFIWGEAGAGKTTLAMDLLGMIASGAGPVLFVSAVEGRGRSLLKKKDRLQLDALNYDIRDRDAWDLDHLKTSVLERGYRGVLLDAVSSVDTWAARTTFAFVKWAKAHDVVFIYIGWARKSLATHLGSRELALRADVNIRCYLEKPGLGRNLAEVMTNPYAVTPKCMAIRMNVDRR